MRFLEVKRHLDKPDMTYVCEVLRRGDEYAVLRYVSDRAWWLGEVFLEAGTTTYAYYRAGAGYVAWKMCGADGELKGHLFHICRDLRVEEDRVVYLDLMLDLWFDPGLQLTVMDREDLLCFRVRGGVSDDDMDWIARQEDEVRTRVGTLVVELDALLA